MVSMRVKKKQTWVFLQGLSWEINVMGRSIAYSGGKRRKKTQNQETEQPKATKL